MFGNLIPDLIEIRQPGSNATPATLPGSVVINTNASNPTSIDLIVPAPIVLTLVVSPRKVENHIATDKMPDDSGELQYWESFSIQMPTFVVAAQDNGQGQQTARADNR